MNLNEPDLLEGLPGEDRVRQGLTDFRNERTSLAACVVRMADPRLSQARFLAPSSQRDVTEGIKLYRMLSESEGTHAFSSYKAPVRELISFQHALNHRLTRQRQPAWPPLSSIRQRFHSCTLPFTQARAFRFQFSRP